jgi:hypothetical protein
LDALGEKIKSKKFNRQKSDCKSQVI